jgi:hypothetical protein
MTDEQTHEQRLQRRRLAIAEEFNNNPQAVGQAILDRIWQSRLDQAAEARRRERELNPTGLKIW